MKYFSLFFLMIGSLAFGSGDPIMGAQKSSTCSACHGPQGESAAPLWPNLGAQHALYLVEQIKAFQSGLRQDPSMTPMAAPLSTQDMEDIAAFYERQKRPLGQAEPNLVARGEQLYRGGDFDKKITACIACHGPNGRGNAQTGFPALSGQKSAYTKKQLLDFKQDLRTSDYNHIMRDIAKRMDPDDMEALASYIQGLR